MCFFDYADNEAPTPSPVNGLDKTPAESPTPIPSPVPVVEQSTAPHLADEEERATPTPVQVGDDFDFEFL